jgi:hypothetical protein
MKFKNFTIYFFAVIGFVVIACSAAATADDNPDDNPNIPPIVQSSIGKYQISTLADGLRITYMTSVNTETGVSKTYWRGNKIEDNKAWTEHTNAAITFTH